MTDAELEVIAARLKAATPGPWEAAPPNDYHCIWIRTGPGNQWRVCGVGEDRPADAALIAHAPSDLAALLAALREARATAEAALEADTEITEYQIEHVSDSEHAWWLCDWADEVARLRAVLRQIAGGDVRPVEKSQ